MTSEEIRAAVIARRDRAGLHLRAYPISGPFDCYARNAEQLHAWRAGFARRGIHSEVITKGAN